MSENNDWREVLGLRSPTEERNPRTGSLDQLDSAELVTTIIAEDAGVVGAVEAVAPAIARLVDLAVAAIGSGGRVHYVGSGTSGRLGVLDAVELLPTYGVGEEMFVAHLAGGDGAMMQAVEGAEDDVDAGVVAMARVAPADLVVGLTASGRTPFVGGALAEARRVGARTALVATNPYSVLAAEVDVAVLVDTGPEVVTGSTRMKAGTAQKLVLNTFSTATMVRLGRTYSNLMTAVLPTNQKLRARTVRMLVQATGIDAARCAEVFAEAGDARAAIVSLLAHVPVARARMLLQENPPDPARTQDPGGVRTAVAAAARQPPADERITR
ncbi:MAG: N-acetylmuramic acid 6-phosphate etherase [Actinomycetales bacterium]|nr:N-acetylmuramic acid 6-phosphate etherase [Actinomycetales bacterium]